MINRNFSSPKGVFYLILESEIFHSIGGPGDLFFELMLASHGPLIPLMPLVFRGYPNTKVDE